MTAPDPAQNAESVRFRDAATDRLHISTYRDRWNSPMARYAVHRMATRHVPFTKLADAKAFCVEHYGPLKWAKTIHPDGRGTRSEWWPKVPQSDGTPEP